MSPTATTNRPPRITATASDGFRQVLAVVDLDAPVEPVIRRAVSEGVAHGVPLQVIVVYPRPGFTTDPAIAARVTRRLAEEQGRVVAAVTDAAQRCGLSSFGLRLVPLSRIPLIGRLAQVQRTVAAQLRQQPTSLVVAAEHLTTVAGHGSMSEPGAGLSADRRRIEGSNV